MKYLLDTNTIVRYLNGRAPKVRTKIRATPLADLAVSSIVVAELRFGAGKALTRPRLDQRKMASSALSGLWYSMRLRQMHMEPSALS